MKRIIYAALVAMAFSGVSFAAGHQPPGKHHVKKAKSAQSSGQRQGIVIVDTSTGIRKPDQKGIVIVDTSTGAIDPSKPARGKKDSPPDHIGR